MESKTDTRLTQTADVLASLGLLSRLPVPVDTAHATARGARAAWAFPIVGLVVGALAALVGSLAGWLGLPPVIAALFALVTMVFSTGAMHEDGLADTADGLWGGWDKARRLEIMKDSRIGTYGVLALVLSMGLRVAALSGLAAAGQMGVALLIVAPLSRAVMPAMMVGLPNARDGGLSHAVGRPERSVAWVALALGFVPALLFLPMAVIALALSVGAVTCGIAALAKIKIGGQTGDILGATQQVAEIAALLALLAIL